MDQIIQQCPICGTRMPPNPRYPRAVCSPCMESAVDISGRPLRFFNESISGGIYGVYQDTGEQTLDTTCFIGGVGCTAQEAHMGGIVILPRL